MKAVHEVADVFTNVSDICHELPVNRLRVLVAAVLAMCVNAALDGCAFSDFDAEKTLLSWRTQHKYSLILVLSFIALIWIARVVLTVYRLGRLDAVGQVKFWRWFYTQSASIQCMLHYIMALCGTTLISDVFLALQVPNFVLSSYLYGDYGCRALSVVDMFHKAYSCIKYRHRRNTFSIGFTHSLREPLIYKLCR